MCFISRGTQLCCGDKRTKDQLLDLVLLGIACCLSRAQLNLRLDSTAFFSQINNNLQFRLFFVSLSAVWSRYVRFHLRLIFACFTLRFSCNFLMCRQFFQIIAILGILLGVLSSSAQSLWPNLHDKCSGTGSKLKYLSGDALLDSPSCIGPNDLPYPSATINRAFNGGSSRKGRHTLHPSTVDPMVMQSTLLNAYREVNDETTNTRHGELKLSFAQNPERVESSHVPLGIARRKSLSVLQDFSLSHHCEEPSPDKQQLSAVSICVLLAHFLRFQYFHLGTPPKCVRFHAEK